MSFQDVAPRRVAAYRMADTKSEIRHASSRMHKRPSGRLTQQHPAMKSEMPRTRTPPSRDSRTRTPKVVTPPHQSAHTPKSRFSRLSDEVVHFQKLVLKLEPILKRSVQSPEDQWRSRILVRSAEEADRDIWQKLQLQEQSLRQAIPEQKTWSAHFKLNRDYGRIHDGFRDLLSKYNVASGGDVPAPIEWLSPEEIQKKRVAQQQEDFFMRAMREREAEVKGINKSMHQVNEIYKELGRMVESQQDQIDQIGDHVRYSRANAECGHEHVAQANSPYCMDIALEQRSVAMSESSDPTFHWSLPFETIKEDMKSVQMDIVDLGKDILTYSAGTTLMNGKKSMLNCASVEDVSDSTYYR